ncbi:uncharacterized protein LOC143285921 [Babylonia areolata]|uniref:uncharacterized protein LOC143285921 n=1 Tax=Babylonia areolata TaxID=304850 RepID=UPI003FD3C05F
MAMAAFNLTDTLPRLNETMLVSNGSYPEQMATNSAGCVELSPASLNPCDHPDSLVSKATRQLVEDVVYVGLLPVLTGVGAVLNAVNMAVFVAQGLADRVHFCLFSLSLVDFLVLTSLYVRYLNRTLAYVISPSWAYDVWMTSLVRYRLILVHSGFQLVSNFISIVVAVDRCVCVRWPLSAARVLSTRVTGTVLVIFSILVMAGLQFVAFKYDVTCAVIRGQAEPFPYILPSTLYRQHPMLMEILDTLIFSSLVPALSLLITIVATTITVVTLRRAAAWRGRTRGRGAGGDVIDPKEKALTYMLVVISCVYVVCVGPRVVRTVCRFIFPEFRAWGRLCGLMLVTGALMNALLALNSTINFFIYYVMGSRFRDTLRHLMTRFRPKRQNSCLVTVPTKSLGKD